MRFTLSHIITLALFCSSAVVEASENADLRHPAGTDVVPSGAIIFGPVGNRKTYLPVVQIMVPQQFLGAWAAAEEGCDAKPVPVVGDKQTEGTKMVVTDTHIITHNGQVHYLGAYIEAKKRADLARAGRAHRSALPSKRLLKSDQVTFWVRWPNVDETGYVTLQKSAQPMTIEYSENGLPAINMVRCFLNVQAEAAF